MASNSSDQMRFNVGGKVFETTATTLSVAGPDSFFGPYLNGNWNVQTKNQQDAIFIDRDPKCFSVILNLLRTGELHVPPKVPKDLLLKEAQYYGVLDLVRAVAWGPFDGNRLSLSTSVKIPGDRAPATVLRASPTGGCCIAHGSTIRVYDCMLREQSPIILDYKFVNDIAWIDSNNIIVTAPKGIKLFNLSTGEQTLEFQLSEDDHANPNFSFCTLCVDNDHKIYSGLHSDISYEKGIVVWDPQRSEPIDVFHLSYFLGSGLAKVDKLQWLPNKKSLLVGSNDSTATRLGCRYYHLTLLDLRQRKQVWSLSHADKKGIQLRDIVVMENRNTIFVVDENEMLGCIDLRFKTDIQWCSRTGGRRGNTDRKQKVKLIEHEGQLFSSKGDRISVYSLGGHKLSLTSKLRTINTSWIDEITDVSIANDRLFSLCSPRGGEASFDVWETSAF